MAKNAGVKVIQHYDQGPSAIASIRAPPMALRLPFTFIRNIALQCAACNQALHFSGADVGHAMAEELKRRYGPDYLDQIKRDNASFISQKMEVWEIVAKAKMKADVDP